MITFGENISNFAFDSTMYIWQSFIFKDKNCFYHYLGFSKNLGKTQKTE